MVNSAGLLFIRNFWSV